MYYGTNHFNKEMHIMYMNIVPEYSIKYNHELIITYNGI